jgi:hypothetical protein
MPVFQAKHHSEVSHMEDALLPNSESSFDEALSVGGRNQQLSNTGFSILVSSWVSVRCLLDINVSSFIKAISPCQAFGKREIVMKNIP